MPSEWHGLYGEETWPAPKLVVECDKPNRADQGNKTASHEYMDHDVVLKAKIKLVADMIKRSRCLVAYTGAGLSRASGIPDYASKAAKSVSGAKEIANPLRAQPTYAHHVLTALERAGYLKHYVQQNHDGLPQKSGFPQEKMNEIHGAWFDPSNPVVQFSGNLRGDLVESMFDMEKKADMCLCLGTSLSGMNADRMARRPAKRAAKGEKGILGTVLINLQRTCLDDISSVRIWAKLDDAFGLLVEELQLPVQIQPLPRPASDAVWVPYDKNGKKSGTKQVLLDLSPGQQIFICCPEASNAGAKGTVGRKDEDGHYCVALPDHRYAFGSWWLDVASRGAVPQLPLINVDARVRTAPAEEAPKPRPSVAPAGAPVPGALRVVQSHQTMHSDGNNHSWGLKVAPEHCAHVSQVTWHLHPTFQPSAMRRTEAPFEVTCTGWGTFTVGIEMQLHNGVVVKGSHHLTFAAEGDDVAQTEVNVA